MFIEPHLLYTISAIYTAPKLSIINFINFLILHHKQNSQKRHQQEFFQYSDSLKMSVPYYIAIQEVKN